MLDLRFPTALQIMLSVVDVEKQGCSCVSSAQLAEGLGVNPSFVRTLLIPLVQQGFLLSSMGKNGGVRLAQLPDQITLRQIYEAVTNSKKLWSTRQDLPHCCLVSSNFEGYFEELSREADNAMLEVLGSHTLAQSYAELAAKGKCCNTTEALPTQS